MISSVIRAPTIEKNHLEFWGDLLDETNEKETIREIPNTNKRNAEDEKKEKENETTRDKRYQEERGRRWMRDIKELRKEMN